MKIQCDVCEKAPATLICCADEAALCARCDTEVHAANKLASKHQRLLLQTLSNKLPPCDICQEKTAFIFCVEDRALFCRDCDEPIHSAGSLAANHQRFLATGIRVALSSSSAQEAPEKSHHEPPPPSSKNVTDHVPQVVPMKTPTHQVSGYTSPSWAVDDLLQFSDFESPNKKEQLEFGELEWLTDYASVFGDEAAEVPQLPASQSINTTSYRQTKFYIPNNKKPRYEISNNDEDDDEHFTVPDLG
ncbi:B-box zinc finger protein 25-like [Cynara cardunculus var. scolymus]|uniref:Zinc finger, B-box n=1 Tax=Cynara cardunculus var. scolymus TaxID=59895 RepID=A0A103Y0V2_CYNCS|nr:B-box zinc finger protein 25-like [Cynara cardunculus var. scolymus]KVI00461.1 Zinc finger, B-box [Cynara cardunculus var. scolymus]